MSKNIKNSINKIKKFRVKKKFSYNSKNNTFLSIRELKKILLEIPLSKNEKKKSQLLGRVFLELQPL